MTDSVDDTLTVFLGRGLLSQGIRQTIEDFTATGLIRDLVWVDADVFENSSSPVTELRVDDSGLPHITRRPFNELVSRSGARKMNLGVINVTDSAEGMLSYAELAPLTSTIDSVCSNLEVHRTNLMITSVGAPLDGELPILSGYINLMLAPEDSSGPDSSTIAYHHEDLDHTFVLHCTAGIASIFGLWEGSTSVPVTDLEPAKGRSFRLVRAFYRHIDGQAVQSRLKELILTTEENPLPQINDHPGKDTTAQYTESPATFGEKAAAEFLGEFGDVLTVERKKDLVRNTRVISSRQASGEFLRAWVRNMTGTPRRAWNTLRSESSTLADDALQAAIYGTSGTSVRVGSESDELQYSDPAGRSTANLVEEDFKSAADLHKVWEAYKNMSLSLLDAEPRFIGGGDDAHRRPAVVSNNSSPRVVVARRAADVVPGPDSHYGDNLPVEIKVRVGAGDVPPYDVIGVQDFEQRLSQENDSGQRGVGRIIGEFRHWRGQNSTSFSYFVGNGLRQIMHQHEMEKRQLTSKIEQMRNQSAEQPAESRMGPVFRWLGWVTFWSGVLFTGVWGVINWRHEAGDVLPTWVMNLNGADAVDKWLLFGIWFLLWVLCWILQVVGITRDQLKFRSARDTIAVELRTAEENLEIVDRSIKRSEVGYRQFLSTSKIIGTLLEQPFGEIQREHRDPLILLNAVPDSVVFAEATPDSEAVEQLARRFRRDLFEQGWLDNHVRTGIRDAADLLTDSTNSAVDPARIFGTTGEGSYGQLAQLAEIIISDEFRSTDRSGDIWKKITEELAHDPVTYRSGVLDSLTVYHAGKAIPAPQRTSLENSALVGSFNGEIATEIGRIHSILQLDPSFCQYDKHPNAFDSIGLSEVLLQVSGPVREEDIAFRRGEKEGLSPELLEGMPVDEEFRSELDPTEGHRYSVKNNRNTQLPGMGEY